MDEFAGAGFTGHDNVRLPKTIKPILYDLKLTPDLEAFTFSGRVAIDIEVLEEARCIFLHAKELTIHTVVFEKDTKQLYPSVIEIDEETEQVGFTFDEPLPLGEARLIIDFNGILNDQMSGFYRSVYTVDGEEKIMATTQFEDTDARRAFPCWDEPAMKARFKVMFKIPNELDVISSMPAINEVLVGPDKKIVQFDTTPIMSTYLLAFVVGEVEHIEGRTKDGTLVRVFTTPGKKEQGQFALDVSIRTIEFYNEYFDIPYPLPKLDMIAIPDFAAGAMENWGLITYRETALLFDPDQSSAASKQRVTVVITHEIAHMWFGNLVTMEWWTQLWLNEGFATWMMNFAADHLFPEWNLWEQFVSHDYYDALDHDGLRSTHPIEVIIHHPSEIKQSFDAISYEKGASIIRMIHAFLGPELFREGLRTYLKRHAYANATTEDLWQALEDVSGKSVGTIMNTWTKQPGYPVVTVQETEKDEFRIHQRRFLSSGTELTIEERLQMWSIALPFKVKMNKGKADQNRLLLKDRGVMVYLLDTQRQWVKFNTGQVAFARVNYTPELWDALKTAVEQDELSSIDRLGLVSDLYAFVEAGLVSTTQLLSFLESYRHEKEYIVWSELIGSLGGVSSLLPNDGKARDAFDIFARSILRHVAGRVGWEEGSHESHVDRMLRPMALNAFGHYGDLETINEVIVRFQNFLDDPNSLNPNLRAAVYSLVARYGDETMFKTLVNCYQKAERQEEKERFLMALGRFQDEAILRRVLEFALSKDVRSQDMHFPIISVASNSRGRDHAWKFMQEHWDEISKRLAKAIFRFSTLIESTLGQFQSEEKAEEVEQFFKDHPTPQASRAIAKSLERIRMRARWFGRDYSSIEHWLTAQKTHS